MISGLAQWMVMSNMVKESMKVSTDDWMKIFNTPAKVESKVENDAESSEK
jgi:hypothetical protein